jgi:hypothetical protein
MVAKTRTIQYQQWAIRCGLRAEDFQARLKDASKHECRYQHGRDVLAKCLQCKNATQWQHARLVCTESAIHKAAAEAAREVGGEALVDKAADEISELMSAENVRLSRLCAIPNKWRDKRGLNLPADCYRTLGYMYRFVRVVGNK